MINYYELLTTAYTSGRINATQRDSMKNQASKNDFIDTMNLGKYEMNHGKGQITIILLSENQAIDKLCEYLQK
jgi:hypothetical protein